MACHSPQDEGVLEKTGPGGVCGMRNRGRTLPSLVPGGVAPRPATQAGLGRSRSWASKPVLTHR